MHQMSSGTLSGWGGSQHSRNQTEAYDLSESIATLLPDSALDVFVGPSRCKRKLDVQFISGSDKYGETQCVVVFKQKHVETRNVF